MSPFQLENPNAIRLIEAADGPSAPALTPEQKSILEEGGATEEGASIGREIGLLRSPILAAQREEDASALEAIEGTPEHQSLVAVGVATRDVHLKFDATQKSIWDDAPSVERQTELREVAEGERGEGLNLIAENVLSVQGDSLLSRFPEPGFAPEASVEASSEAQLIYASFSAKAVATFIGEALGFLRRAIDPAVADPERFRANRLIRVAYAPLTERRALSPERFARALQAQHVELAELIQTHLATISHQAAHGLAIAFVDQVRQDFRYLVRMAREHGSWDATFEIGAASFDWD